MFTCLQITVFTKKKAGDHEAIKKYVENADDCIYAFGLSIDLMLVKIWV